MLNAINKFLDAVLVLFLVSFVALLTWAEGLIGFYAGMGFVFSVLIIFVIVMTFIERMTTGTWWFLDLKNK